MLFYVAARVSTMTREVGNSKTLVPTSPSRVLIAVIRWLLACIHGLSARATIDDRAYKYLQRSRWARSIGWGDRSPPKALTLVARAPWSSLSSFRTIDHSSSFIPIPNSIAAHSYFFSWNLYAEATPKYSVTKLLDPSGAFYFRFAIAAMQ